MNRYQKFSPAFVRVLPAPLLWLMTLFRLVLRENKGLRRSGKLPPGVVGSVEDWRIDMVQLCVVLLMNASNAFSRGELREAEEQALAALRNIDEMTEGTPGGAGGNPFFNSVSCNIESLLAQIREQQSRFKDARRLRFSVLERTVALAGYSGKCDWSDPLTMVDNIKRWKLESLGSEAPVFFHSWETKFSTILADVVKSQTLCGDLEAAHRWGAACEHRLATTFMQESPDQTWERWLSEGSSVPHD